MRQTLGKAMARLWQGYGLGEDWDEKNVSHGVARDPLVAEMRTCETLITERDLQEMICCYDHLRAAARRLPCLSLTGNNAIHHSAAHPPRLLQSPF